MPDLAQVLNFIRSPQHQIGQYIIKINTQTIFTQMTHTSYNTKERLRKQRKEKETKRKEHIIDLKMITSLFL